MSSNTLLKMNHPLAADQTALLLYCVFWWISDWIKPMMSHLLEHSTRSNTHTQAPATDISSALRVNKHLYKRSQPYQSNNTCVYQRCHALLMDWTDTCAFLYFRFWKNIEHFFLFTCPEVSSHERSFKSFSKLSKKATTKLFRLYDLPNRSRTLLPYFTLKPEERIKKLHLAWKNCRPISGLVNSFCIVTLFLWLQILNLI